MLEKIYETKCGAIHYWVSDKIDTELKTLIFLPGLTADHRLFDKQIECFEHRYNMLVWDAPAHNKSYPFLLDFGIADKAVWLYEILSKEGIKKPIIVGQSMGGYVGQSYIEQFPNDISGFIAIDSSTLQKKYYSAFTLWLMRNVEPIYRIYPWKTLVKSGSWGVATTEYGRNLMTKMMMEYDCEPRRYTKLVGHGYRILADAIDADLSYKIKCPALLICGKNDIAGTTRKYNKLWAKKAGLPIVWIDGAGHNSNTDAPEKVNELIEYFLSTIIKK